MTKNWKRSRKVATSPIIEKKYYIFCEGEKTEPNYFKGIKRKIERKALYKNAVFVDVQGVGKGTLKILDTAVDYVKRNKITDAEIWIVYDKDEFLAEDFNKVAIMAEKLNNDSKDITYNVAWSNQCIEYWFILHFDYYESDNDRKYYIDYLNQKFKELDAGEYKKNRDDIFEILEKFGNADQAVKFANKRLKEFKGCSDANSVPATKVHLLYTRLKEYFS